MKKQPSRTHAIRQVLIEGGHADYADVAVAVKKKFGLTVGSGKVEEVAIAMRREAAATSPAAAKRKAGSQPPASGSAPAPDLAEVRSFVERMGGFRAARAAIDELEASYRKLMD